MCESLYEMWQSWIESAPLNQLASFSGILHLQFLITCSMQKRKEKVRGISSCDPSYNCHMSSHLLSTAKCCTRPISHSLLATKVGQAPAESYTECMNVSRLKAATLKGYRVQSSRGAKDGTIYLGLHYLNYGHPSAVKLQTRICFTNRTYLSSGSCFDSLASL